MADCANNRCYDQPVVQQQPQESKNWQSTSACEAYSRPGKTVAVDGQSKPDYDKMIKDNFQYTQDNYADAYKAAAREGKPVVAVFGSWEHNNTRDLIQNALPASGAQKDAIYLYVDPAKCKDENLKKFAEGQLAGGHNAAVSIVFNVKPDEKGNPQPTEYNFRWQGAQPSMIPSFKDAINKAQDQMNTYKDKFSKDVPEAPAPKSKEELDQAKKAQEETARKTAEETARKATEETARKATEETARKAAEAQKTEESAKKLAELQKNLEETTKKLNELQKTQDEAARKEKERAATNQKIIDTAVAVAAPGVAIGMAAAKVVAPVAKEIVKENAKDLTIPAEIAVAGTKAVVDHVEKHPTRTVAELALLGPAAPAVVAADVIISNPATQRVAGDVADAVKEEVKDTAKALVKYPGLPVVGLVEKNIKDGVEVGKMVVGQVASIPASAQEFDKARPVTATVIDTAASYLPIPGIESVIAPVGKAGVQKVSNGIDRTFKYLGIR